MQNADGEACENTCTDSCVLVNGNNTDETQLPAEFRLDVEALDYTQHEREDAKKRKGPRVKFTPLRPDHPRRWSHKFMADPRDTSESEEEDVSEVRNAVIGLRVGPMLEVEY